MRIREIVAEYGGEAVGDAEVDVDRVSAVEDASPGSITFAVGPDYFRKARESGATAVVGPVGADMAPKTVIRTRDVLGYVSKLLTRFHPRPRPAPGVHARAVVAASAVLGQRVSVGAGAVIEDDCRIGDDCVVGPGAVVGRGSVIGAGSRVDANAVIHDGVQIGRQVVIHAGAVIGSDGFGFIPGKTGAVRIPQVGSVRIDDGVEIGANSCIDRAMVGVTRIRAGAKIDNLVQVGHNCDVGEGTILVAQSGLSGSVRLGRGVMIGGQAGVSDHVKVGDGVRLGGSSALRDDIPAGQRWVGYPAQLGMDWVRGVATLRKLIKIYPELKKLLGASAADAEEERGFLRPPPTE